MVDKLLLDLTTLTDTHERLQLGQELIEYFENEGHKKKGFPDFGNLIGGLTTWLDASSIQVNLMSMRILSTIVDIVKKDFYIYINTIFDALVKRLGDAKKLNRKSAHCLLLQVLDECTDNPQPLLDRLLNHCLSHKNSVMKEQGLKFLVKTLNHFETEKIEYKKYISMTCKMTSDSNAKIRKAAENALVGIYHIAGPEVREEINRSDNLSPSKLRTLNKKLRDSDLMLSTKSHLSRLQVFQERSGMSSDSCRKLSPEGGSSQDSFNNDSHIKEPVGSKSTKSSVGTKSPPGSKKGAPSHAGSIYSQSSHPTIKSKRVSVNYKDGSLAGKSSSLRALHRPVNALSPDGSSDTSVHPRVVLTPPITGNRSRSRSPMPQDRYSARFNSPGMITAADFERAFGDVKNEMFRNKKDLDNKLYDIIKTLRNTKFHWEMHMNSLKQIRTIFSYCHNNNMTDYLRVILAEVAECLSIPLKDLRSQVMKEACVTVGYICNTLGGEASSFAGVMMQELIPHLSSTVKVMASSADVCISYIIKKSPSPMLLVHLSTLAFPYKSNIVHSTTILSKQLKLIEEMIQLTVKDADASARKYGRKSFWRYHQNFPERASKLHRSFSAQHKKYLEQDKLHNMDQDVILAEEALESKDQKMQSKSDNSNKISSAKMTLKFEDDKKFHPDKTGFFQIYPENNTQDDKIGLQLSGNSLNTICSTITIISDYSSGNSMEANKHSWNISNVEGMDHSRASKIAAYRGTSDNSLSVSSKKHRVRSVNIQVSRKCRNVGVQAVRSSKNKRQDKGDVILQIKASDLAEFIEHTVEKFLAQHDMERMDAELEQMKVLLDSSVKKILHKLDSSLATTSNYSSRILESNLNKASRAATVNWGDAQMEQDSLPSRQYYGSRYLGSLTSLADSDTRGNLTPPPPTPSSSYASLADLQETTVLSSSPTLNSSTLLSRSDRYSDTSSNRQFRMTTLQSTSSSNSPISGSRVHYRSAPSQSSLNKSSYALHAETSVKSGTGLRSSEQSLSELTYATDESEMTGSHEETAKSNLGSTQRNNFVMLLPMQMKQLDCGHNSYDNNKP